MASFKVDGKEYELPTDVTIDEMCEAEDAFDMEFGTSRFKQAKALVWIAMRRAGEEPEPASIGALPVSLFADAAADASPPAVKPEEPKITSGEPSEQASGIPDDPRDSGSPGSVTGSDSARETFFSLLQAS